MAQCWAQMRPQLGSCVRFRAPRFRTDIEGLEQAQSRALEHKCEEQQLRELGLFIREKRGSGVALGIWAKGAWGRLGVGLCSQETTGQGGIALS